MMKSPAQGNSKLMRDISISPLWSSRRKWNFLKLKSTFVYTFLLSWKHQSLSTLWKNMSPHAWLQVSSTAPLCIQHIPSAAWALRVSCWLQIPLLSHLTLPFTEHRLLLLQSVLQHFYAFYCAPVNIPRKWLCIKFLDLRFWLNLVMQHSLMQPTYLWVWGITGSNANFSVLTHWNYPFLAVMIHLIARKYKLFAV